MLPVEEKCRVIITKPILMNESGMDVPCDEWVYVRLTQRDCLQSSRGTGKGSAYRQHLKASGS